MSVDDYTDDEKWLIVTGRRWRRTDPGLEPPVVEELKSHLGAARNAVGKAKKAGAEDDLAEARRRVNAAKIGLGERGDYWWEMAIEDRRARAEGVAGGRAWRLSGAAGGGGGSAKWLKRCCESGGP